MGTRMVDEALDVLVGGTAEVIEVDDLRRKLEKSQRTGRPLLVKLGADPSAPDLHLGHAVVLRKLRQFQDFGHEVVFLIGDFTGRIGDPTDRAETRRQLTAEEVAANAATYQMQVGRILDSERTRIAFNSSWLSDLSFADVIRLAAKHTVARMLEREDFKARFKAERPIHLHEFFYPLMQGQDSVALGADVELGGTDQKFNLMITRSMMREAGLEPEVAMMLPILVGLDGVKKMSKSLGNHISLDDPPDAMFGKTMSIPDGAIIEYMRLAAGMPEDQVKTWERDLGSGAANPRDAKAAVGRAIVALFHGAEAARTADEGFRRVFSGGGVPEDVAEVPIVPGERLVELLDRTGLVRSRSEARRLMAQGAVTLDGALLGDPTVPVTADTTGVLRVGKRRFVRLMPPAAP